MQISFIRFLSLRLSMLLLLSVLFTGVVPAQEDDVVANGKQVSIELILTTEDGTEFSSNVGKEPIVYRHNNNEMPPALEKELLGMKVEEHKKVTLPPEDTFGPVQPEAFVEIDLERLPEEARTAGTNLMIDGPDGNPRSVRVHEIKGDKAVIDFNHPLAGKTLTFDVKIVNIE
jgi:FKBP-type peptidyl-prolyl cis-trans isomerase 2